MMGFPDGSFDMAEVDPPYGIDLDKLKRGKESATATIHDYTEVPYEEYADFLTKSATEVYRLLKPNTFCIWWFGISNYEMVKTVLKNVGFQVNPVPAIWSKGLQGQTNNPDTNLANCYETFFVARKGNALLLKPGESNIFLGQPVAGHMKIHATQRPVDMIGNILTNFVHAGQHILIPFLGSGATLQAAYRRHMTGIGWDLDEGIKNKFLLQIQADDQLNKRGEDYLKMGEEDDE
jgi:site-specific DNA-methyltransferase (adenine-specific)